MIFLKIFWVFLKIGIFGFGGGYAMLSLIQDEVVTQNLWMTNKEFTDLVAISQTTPGPIGINTATYAGYKAVENAGFSPGIAVLGSILATLTVNLPAFILIILISYSYRKFKNNPWFKALLRGIRPLSIALIGFAAYSLMTPQNFIDNLSPVFFLLTLLISLKFKWHPVILILLIALAGMLIY
ncbi:MAG: chromate transporter [Flavobacteriaceae bacterium]|nr:chromate transporter [Flavobacteriaceae bacterium]